MGIDGSSVRSGGGVSYLAGLLDAASPAEQGIDRIRVWAKRSTLAQLPDRPWLDRLETPLLERPLPMRVWWQRFVFPGLVGDCDVVFVPGGTAPYDLAPMVTMSQNMLPFDRVEARRYGPGWVTLRLKILRRTQLRSFARSQGVIFLSDHARREISAALGAGPPSATIPHGISDAFRIEPRRSRPLSACSPDDPLRLLYVSIVDVYKHQWHVAEAVARLRRAGLPVALDLVGPAYQPALSRLKKTLDELDPEGSFLRYHGAVPHSVLPDHLRKAELFVFASSCENLPNILIEGMAAGLPIACSRRPPMPDVLGDAGETFDPEDVDQIESVVGELARDVDRRDELARRAWEQSQGYSWKRCADETLSFLAATARAAAA